MVIRRYLNVFGDAVPWYGICISIALASMAISFYINLRKRGTTGETLFLMAFPLMCCFGVLTSFLLDAAFTGDWHTWFGDGDRKFGLTFTGFLVGVIVFLSVYGRQTKLGARYLLNVFLPPLAIAQSIGRVGCFLGGCCYGVPCSHGISYPKGSLPYTIVGDVPLCPVQLVEALLLAILALVLAMTKTEKRMYVYVVGASVIRFSVEYFRFDYRGTLFGLSVISPQQLISLVLLVVFVILFIADYRRCKWAR